MQWVDIDSNAFSILANNYTIMNNMGVSKVKYMTHYSL
jgi:hypothetical protein